MRFVKALVKPVANWSFWDIFALRNTVDRQFQLSFLAHMGCAILMTSRRVFGRNYLSLQPAPLDANRFWGLLSAQLATQHWRIRIIFPTKKRLQERSIFYRPLESPRTYKIFWHPLDGPFLVLCIFFNSHQRPRGSHSWNEFYCIGQEWSGKKRIFSGGIKFELQLRELGHATRMSMKTKQARKVASVSGRRKSL